MIFNEIKCHVNTCLGLVGGMHPLHPPCVRAWFQVPRLGVQERVGFLSVETQQVGCLRE